MSTLSVTAVTQQRSEHDYGGGRPRGERRFDLASLLDATELGQTALQREVRCNSETIQRAAEHGLTDREADRFATRCGLHPALVWPEQYWGGDAA